MKTVVLVLVNKMSLKIETIMKVPPMVSSAMCEHLNKLRDHYHGESNTSKWFEFDKFRKRYNKEKDADKIIPLINAIGIACEQLKLKFSVRIPYAFDGIDEYKYISATNDSNNDGSDYSKTMMRNSESLLSASLN